MRDERLEAWWGRINRAFPLDRQPVINEVRREMRRGGYRAEDIEHVVFSAERGLSIGPEKNGHANVVAFGTAKPAAAGRMVADSTEKPKPLDWLDMSRWDDEPIPKRQWAIRDRVPLR